MPGAIFWCRVFAGCIAFWILRKTGWVKSKSLAVAASVQAGQAIWMLVGLVAVLAAPSRSSISINTAICVEIIAYAAAVGVLVWRQEKWIVIVLLAYHALCTILNVLNLAGLVPAVVGPHSIVAHLLLRTAAVIFLTQFLREKPKENFVEVF